MKERLLQLLDLENLTPSKFADLIGVQRSSVSHILSDRNKPSYDFLQKTLKTFPGLKADWLMLGEGPMYEHMGRETDISTGKQLKTNAEVQNSDGAIDMQLPFSSDTERVDTSSNVDSLSAADSDQTGTPEEHSVDSVASFPGKRIVQVMLFYDDDTFMTYKPSK